MNQHTHTHTHTHIPNATYRRNPKGHLFFFLNSPLKHDLSLSVFFSFVINIFELLLCFWFLCSKFHFWIKKKKKIGEHCANMTVDADLQTTLKKRKRKLINIVFFSFFKLFASHVLSVMHVCAMLIPIFFFIQRWIYLDKKKSFCFLACFLLLITCTYM